MTVSKLVSNSLFNTDKHRALRQAETKHVKKKDEDGDDDDDDHDDKNCSRQYRNVQGSNYTERRILPV